MDEHEHENGFQHLDLPLTGLAHKYDLGWKSEPNTDGPPGYLDEPYLLLYISFLDDGPATGGAKNSALRAHTE
jgi:hypothetical protein